MITPYVFQCQYFNKAIIFWFTLVTLLIVKTILESLIIGTNMFT